MSNISPGHFFNNLATTNNTDTKELEEKSNSSNERSMELSARPISDSFTKSDRDIELMELNDSASNSFEKLHQDSEECMKHAKPKHEGNHTDSGEAFAFNLKKSKHAPDIHGVLAVAALKTRKRFREYAHVRLPSGNQRHWRNPLLKGLLDTRATKILMSNLYMIHQLFMVYPIS